MEKAPIIDITNFKTIKTIGYGASSYVDLVEEVTTGRQYAMKYIFQKISTQEIDSYIKIDDPNILKFYGYNFSDPKKLVLLLEYMPNGSLESVLKKLRLNNPPSNFTGTKKYIILRGIARGMNYLHSHSIIHRDLKTDNILLDENFYPKICDFNISYVSDLPCSTVRINGSVGTPLYKSPEILTNQSYSYKIDVYSFALIAYELITGITPFDGYKTKFQIYEDVKEGIRPDVSNLPLYIQDFFNKCWSNDPMKRPTFDDIIIMMDNSCFKDIFKVDESEVLLYDLPFIDKAIEEENDYDVLLFASNVLLKSSLLADKKETIESIKIEADKGNANAMLKYFCILNENKYKPYKNETLKYLKMAADLGHINAMLIYGYILLEGIQIEANKKEAAKYLKKSADLFNSEAMLKYGQMLIDGNGIPVDIDEGISYIKRSADQGHVESMFKYASLLFFGEKIPPNKKESARYLKMAAKQGNGKAAYYYARMLYFGNGVPLDKGEAQKYFKIGGLKGFPLSLYYYSLTLILDYEPNSKTVKKDKKEGFFYITKLIDAGFEQAVTFFWFFVSVNNILNSTPNQETQKKNCFQDIPMSQEEIDVYKQKSIEFFEKECEKGNEYILFFYIDVLSNGLGVPRNPKKEIKYLKQLINKGNARAMYMYAIKLRYGFDVCQDIYEAYDLFQMSANKGDKRSKYFIAEMLHDREIFEELFYAGYASFDDIKDSENDSSYGISACYEKTCEMVRRMSIAEDYDSILDFFGVGINISYPENKHNDDIDIVLSDLKFEAQNGDIDALFYYGQILLNLNDSSFQSKGNAVKYIKEAADKGNAKANLRYGEILYNGNGVKVNKREASKYFKFAADQGKKKAMYYYGKMLYEGNSIVKDSKKGLSYIQKSADLGCSDAISFYGQLIYEGKIADKDKRESVKYFQEAAELDDPVSLLYYGNMLLQGEFVERNKEKGIDFIKKSVELGNAEASLKYGLMLLEGVEIPENKKQAAIYLKKSADQGNEEAILKYSKMLIKGNGIQADTKEASVYLKMLADQGNAEAMYEYGLLLLSNEDCFSAEKAEKYFKESAAIGNANSMCEYGRLKFMKYDKIANVKEAADYFKRSADLGNVEAMSTYGSMLYSGICIPFDHEEALKYLKKSAELKDTIGMLTYARILNQSGDANKMKEARKYYEILIDQNNTEAMFDYGCMYFNGTGVPVNIEESSKYFKMAADLGNSEAMSHIAENLYYGIGVKVDKNESIRYLKKSIELNNNRGRFIYATILRKNNDVESHKEAIKYLKIVIDNGNSFIENKNGVRNVQKGTDDINIYADAMAIYGEMLYNGIGIQADKKESIKYLKKSVEFNNSNGIYMYAKTLLDNEDLESKIKAFNYFKELSSKGNCLAMYEYGMMLFLGNGVPVDKPKAAEYIKKAADLNYAVAMAQYGNMLSDGDGVPVDKRKAVEYFKKAADLEEMNGMFFYGINLFFGIEIPQNQEEGIKYLKKSADLGHPYSKILYALFLCDNKEKAASKK